MDELVKILREAMPESIGGLVAAGVLAAISTLFVRWRTKIRSRENEESVTVNPPIEPSPVKPILPQDLLVKITVPARFDIRGPNSFSDFSRWLSNPLRAGNNPGSFEYPIEGQVLPNVLNLTVKISIYTNQWWDQGRFLVQSDGSFSGSVFLDKHLGRAIFRFDILDAKGISLKYFDATIT